MLEGMPPLLTVAQASEVLVLGRSKTYQLTVEWERTGGRSGIPFVWVGNQKRIPTSALAEWLESQLGRPPAA